MATNTIDLSFLNDSGGNLTLTIAQLQQMDAELKKISERSPALMQLSSAFGITYAQAAKLTAELGVGPARLREAVSTLQQLRGAGADAVTQYAVLANQLGLTVDQMKLLTEQVEELGGQKDVVADLTTAFSSLFVIDKVNQFKGAIIETGKVLETLQTRLKTTLGTQAAADSALDKIQTFAATTPFEMVQVTDAFVKLKQRGIEPTNDALRSLGDLSSSQGKSLDQTVEALLDASQGEFERLKEYGIKASGAGDKVNISFQGMNTQVERTEAGITAGILALGKMEGVAGGMELQSKTLGGALSNLTDSQTKLAGETFKLVQGPAIALVQTATKLIDSFLSLNPAIQQSILGVGVLGGVFVSAVAALAAFKAANIGAAVSLGVKTAAELPAAAATAFNATVTKLAALSEIELSFAKNATTASTVAGTGATGADTAAKVANTAATGAQTAAQGGLNTMTKAGAASAGLMAAAVLGVVASLALVADSYAKSTQGEREAQATQESVAKSLKAVDEAAEKRFKANQARVDATLASAEKTRQSKLSAVQLAAEEQAKDNQYKEEYAKNVQERIGWAQQFLDAIRNIINIPADLFSRTFKFTAELPLPGPIKDFFRTLSEEIDGQLKLGTAATAARESDIIAFGKLSDTANEMSSALNKTKQSAQGGVLGNASKGEIEGLAAGYDTLIDKIEKTVVADASQKAQKDVLLKSLKAESEQVKQAAKLIQEKEKRIASVGTAEAQWAAEVKKVTENVTKQIATSEDANKLIETTKKQLENGFISPEKAAAAFQKVASYTQATGDVQIAAANELNAVRDKQAEQEKSALDVKIQMAEILGLTEVRTAEETATATAVIRKEQADLELKLNQDKLALLASQGRDAGQEGVETKKALAKAEQDAVKAAAEVEVAQRKEAIAKVNKALQDAADERQAIELKASTKVKTGAIKDIKKGDLSLEDADEKISKEAAERQAKALDEEIKLKLTKQRELAAIGGEEAKEAAKKLNLEVLQLQDKAADLELARLKRLQKEKLDEIRKTIEKAKALNDLLKAKSDQDLSARELAAYQQAGADRQAIDEEIAAEKLKANAARLQSELSTGAAELEAIQELGRQKILTAAEVAKRVQEIETRQANKQAEINRNKLEQLKAEEAAKRRQIDEELKAETDRQSIGGAANIGDDEAKAAKLRLAAALGNAKAIEAVLRGEADVRDSIAEQQLAQSLAIAQAEQEALEKRIEANLVADKDIAFERLKASNKVQAEETKLVEFAIAAERKARDEAHKRRLQSFDEVKQLISQEQELIGQVQALQSAANTLESAQADSRKLVVNGRKQEIELAIEAANALGNKGLAEQLSIKAKQLELNLIRSQAEETKRQFDTKRAALELDIQSKQVAAEQLVLEKEMSVLEAKNALEAGIAEGKSQAELSNLAKKVGFAEKALGLASKSAANTDQIANLQRKTLDIEQSNAETGNKQQLRNAEAKFALGTGDKRAAASIAQSGLAQSIEIPPPDYKAVDAASSLLATQLKDLADAAKQTKDALASKPRLAGARKTGGPVGTSGSYIVGEEGPELVTFAQQAYVHTAAQTSRMLGAVGQNSVLPGKGDELLSQLRLLNDQVRQSRQVSPVSVPVNVTANDTNAVAQALAIVRADRAARYSRGL